MEGGVAGGTKEVGRDGVRRQVGEWWWLSHREADGREWPERSSIHAKTTQ